jgi:hypothetical protein
MENTYQETTIGGFKVTVFTGYDGKQLFITDSDGNQIYAHRVGFTTVVMQRFFDAKS